jgi:hypothetical protein
MHNLSLPEFIQGAVAKDPVGPPYLNFFQNVRYMYASVGQLLCSVVSLFVRLFVLGRLEKKKEGRGGGGLLIGPLRAKFGEHSPLLGNKKERYYLTYLKNLNSWNLQTITTTTSSSKKK